MCANCYYSAYVIVMNTIDSTKTIVFRPVLRLLQGVDCCVECSALLEGLLCWKVWQGMVTRGWVAGYIARLGVYQASPSGSTGLSLAAG